MPFRIFFRTVFCFGVSLLLLPALQAQRITVQADSYQQTWQGAGSSIPLFLFNHFQLPPAGQAEAIDLIVDKLELGFLQDYPEFRVAAQPDYYARRAEYFTAAKAVDAEVKISMTFSIFPDDLRKDTVIGGENVRRLDFRRPGIYDDVAGWYFEIMSYYAERGLDVEIVNAVNEPDFIVRRYGFGNDSRRATAMIFDEAISSLKAMIDDPSINTAGVKQPLVMGPSTLSTSAAVGFINYYKENAPAAWDNIDIVSYHQYGAGTGGALATLPNIAEGRPVYQSEMHTNRGDDLPALTNLSVNHRGALSLARTIGASLNGGTNAWFYFLNVFPTDDSNPGLLKVRGGFDRPIPFKHYYAFRQLTSAQAIGSRRVEHELASIRVNDGQVMTFREEGVDTLYVHLTNFVSSTREVAIVATDSTGARLTLKGHTQRTTDATLDDERAIFAANTGSSDTLMVTAGPYSVNTYAVALGEVSPVREVLASGQTLNATRRGDAYILTGLSQHELVGVNKSPSSVNMYGLDGRRVGAQVAVTGNTIVVRPAQRLVGIFLVEVVGVGTVRVAW